LPLKSAGPLLLRGALCLLVTLLLLDTVLVPLGGVPAVGPGSDHGLLTWDMWWVTESVQDGRNPYWTSLLFHPLGSPLASHTLGPGFFPVGLLAKAMRSGDPDYPLYALRLSIGLCYALGMLLACEAFRALGATPVPALAAAVGWAFSASLRQLVGNPTLASAAFLVPLVTLAVITLFERPAPPRAMALGAVVGASVYFSEYYGAFIALALFVAALAGLAWADTRAELVARARALGPAGVGLGAAACLLVAAPFALNWAGTEGRPPKERQIQAGGANLAGFVVPSPVVTPLYDRRPIRPLAARVSRGTPVFLGLPTLLFAGLGMAASDRRRRRVLLAVSFVFLVLSLGPTLRVLGASTGWPMPYEALRHLPPFQMAREPERLAVVGVFGLLALAALGLTRTVEGVSRRRGTVAGFALAGTAFAWWAAEGYAPQLRRPVPYIPPPALSELPPGGVANLPLSIRDGYAMFLQVFHRRPIVTGYVSRTSPQQFAHVQHLQELLDADPAAFAVELRRLGVGTVILEPGTESARAEALAGLGLNILDLRSAAGSP
jgi:hypothetical protein